MKSSSLSEHLNAKSQPFHAFKRKDRSCSLWAIFKTCDIMNLNELTCKKSAGSWSDLSRVGYVQLKEENQESQELSTFKRKVMKASLWTFWSACVIAVFVHSVHYLPLSRWGLSLNHSESFGGYLLQTIYRKNMHDREFFLVSALFTWIPSILVAKILYLLVPCFFAILILFD